MKRLSLLSSLTQHLLRMACAIQTGPVAVSATLARNITISCLLLSSSLMHAPGYAQDSSLVLNGIATQSEFRKELYLAALYLQRSTTDPIEAIAQNSNKRMELRVLAERWSSRSFTNHWSQAILINNEEVDLKTHSAAIQSFTALAKEELIFGDEIVIAFLAGRETRIAINGVNLLTVKSRPLAFFQLIQRAWLGPRPPSSSFKFDLLNLPTSEVTSERLVQFETTVPPEGRAKTMAAWRDDSPSEDDEPAQVAVAKPKPRPAPRPAPKPEPAVQQAAVAPAAPVAAATETPEPEATAEPEATETEQSEKDPGQGLLALYQSNALKRIYSHVIYPERAIDRNQQGTVVIAVTVNRQGKILGSSTAQESKYKLLNNAASKAVSKAMPFPAVPKKLKGDKFDMSFPITFRIPG